MGNKWSSTKAYEVDIGNPLFQLPVRISLEKRNLTLQPTRFEEENLHVGERQNDIRSYVLELDILQSSVAREPSYHIRGFVDALIKIDFFERAQLDALEHGINVVSLEHYYQWGLDLPRAIRDVMREAMPDFQVYETIAKLRGRNRFPVHGVLYHPKDELLPQQEIRGFWSDMRRLFCK